MCELFKRPRPAACALFKAQVDGGRLHSGGVSLASDQGCSMPARCCFSCGAHSAKLTAALTGKRVPLDTERGYHLMLPGEHQRLPFAVTSLERRSS